jgi:general secretion pathway protein D
LSERNSTTPQAELSNPRSKEHLDVVAAEPNPRGIAMTRLKSVAALLLIVGLAALPASADKASSMYNQGRAAEARQDYETAYADYNEAYKMKPSDVRYRAAAERGKFLAAASHVHRGQILRDSGKLQDALAEFQKAVAIDSSSFIAQQEEKRTRQMIEQAEHPAPQSLNTGDVLTRRMEQAAGPVDLAPITNSPITLRTGEDSKVVYETIGKLAGLNVLFDPDYTSRRINIQLNGVTLQDALQIVALESKTFWRPVTPNTIFVAADSPSKRKELEQNVVRTFYLSNLSQPTELQDLVNTIRTIVEVNRVQQLPTQGAVVVRGTPDQVALVQKLIDDIDKARPEVVVEVAIMQVSKTKMRNLGITPPSSVSATLQDNINSNTSTTTNSTTGQTTNTGTTGTSTTTGGVSLNSLAHINATNFQLNIPSATANILFSDADSKLIQNPSIRAVDGQKATLKIGDRIPVATGSFQPGIGGVGINPLVNTQFNYIDVGVNIDVTPRIHANGEVSMKMVLDVSSVTSFQNIGGISQPVIGQRKVEHEIRLKDGEINLLGGILQQEHDKTLQGIPFLSQVPILKYIFGSENINNVDSEVVFAIIPHIVRGYDVSPSNTRAVDVGTGTSIQLSRIPVQPTPAPSAPAQPAAQSNNQPAQGNPNGAVLSFDPATVDAPVGSTVAVNVAIAGGQNVYSVPVQIGYDPKTLSLVNVSNGNFLSRDGQVVALVHRDDSIAGQVQVTATRPPGAPGVSGDGQVFTLTFMAKAPGASQLSIRQAVLRDAAQQKIPATGSQAMITVH